MQGQAEVVEYLKDLLRGELAARDQYFLHSRMYQDWGFTKLYERINHEMEEETQHADALLQRILFLESSPDMRPKTIHPGQTVPDMLRADLKLEYDVRAALSKGITLCEKHKDYVSRDILTAQLKDTEEDHAYWLEQQLGLIDRIGLQNYLQSQAS
ncbi:bacterioferritin [Metapseudomonas boanensis]|uniref:Bacterioferritin n=1 Tax=Metapseudomonas boanensis TaxID=2822138 RepID=A0ABS5XJY0_9GAMM|nr:bacterioferritin [Pseudomonas boanensis]MBT8767996.1 bacterioferritin [Pseudomonas boanensis]